MATLLLASALAPPASATTLLLTSGPVADAEAVRGVLLGTGRFTDAELVERSSAATPPLSELLPHGEILLWTGAPWDDPAALGDALADYVDAGGAVVLAAPSLTAGQGPAGRFEAGGYSPVLPQGSGSVVGDVDLGASDVGSPALAGLADVRFADELQGTPLLAAGGEALAVDSAGALVLAGRCDRSVLALNLSPPSLAVGEPTTSADAALLLAQVLRLTEVDAPPAASLGGPYAGSEGGSIALDGRGSAPGDLGPLAFAWDLNGDGVFTDALGPTVPWDLGALGGPAEAPVALRITDRCGRTSTAAGLAQIANTPPSIDAAGFAPSGSLGEDLRFWVVASDPADPLSTTWTWGDGSPPSSGAAATHRWVAPGAYPVGVEVADGDGGRGSMTAQVTISNPGPSVVFVSGDSALAEGSAGSFEVQAIDALGAGVELGWAFEDGSPPQVGLDLRSVAHAWADDGEFTVQVTATDSLGATAIASRSVAVANVSPIPDPGPSGEAAEATLYQGSLTASDPGADPAIWSLVLGPEGLSVSPEGAVTWTPTFAQAGAAWPVEVLVEDGDGGAATLAWTVPVIWLDADADGLPDTWEAAHGLDPTLDDAAGDLDGDGLSNAEEWALGSSPDLWDGPDAPIPLRPQDGEEVATATPELRVLVAGDPGGDPLSYAFEVYDDASLTLLVDGASGLPPSGAEVSWTPSTSLGEDADHWWRARASDPFVDGPWTVARRLHVDATNAPPPVPVLLEPDGTTVATTAVRLLASSQPDPEGDAITLRFRVYGDELLAQLDPVRGPDGWSAVIPQPLADDRDYSWTAEAVDARGAGSGESVPGLFHLDATNQPPPAPSFDPPLDGGEVDVARPLLALLAPDDPDGDPLVLRVERAPEGSFAGAMPVGLAPVVDGGAAVSPSEDLEENRVGWLRARSEDDRGAASAWVVDRLFVNAVQEPPTAPTLIEPTAESRPPGDGVVLRAAPASDPDGDPLSYELRLAPDEGGPDAAIWSLDLPDPGGEIQGAVDIALDPGGYRAFIRAVDDGGLSGPWASARFVVSPPPPGPALDRGPGAGAGWTCSLGPGSPSPLLLLLLLATAGVRRRLRADR